MYFDEILGKLQENLNNSRKIMIYWNHRSVSEFERSTVELSFSIYVTIPLKVSNCILYSTMNKLKHEVGICTFGTFNHGATKRVSGHFAWTADEVLN